MYGMIHRGIKELVTERCGADAWDQIERELQIGPEHLISAHIYEDALTLRMLQSAADVLETTMHQLMGLFGRYWIRFAERGSYGAIMDFAGKDIVTFLANLDRLHQAVVAAMPGTVVPSFKVTLNQPGRLRVRYTSEREGLEPFVVGLLEGLLARFGCKGQVEQILGNANTPEFELTYAQLEAFDAVSDR